MSMSSQRVEGIVLILVVIGVLIWFGVEAFKTRAAGPVALEKVPTTALTSDALKEAADVATNERNYYGAPVQTPSAGELGKEQLF